MDTSPVGQQFGSGHHRVIRVVGVRSGMPDDKHSREKQARDAERRQREREILEELERQDDTEPPVEEAVLDDVETKIQSLEFPPTGSEVVAAVGDRQVESPDETYTVEELVPETDAVTFDSPAAVRVRVQRPTITAAMERVT